MISNQILMFDLNERYYKDLIKLIDKKWCTFIIPYTSTNKSKMVLVGLRINDVYLRKSVEETKKVK